MLIEKIVLDYLTSALSVPAYVEQPKSGSKYVVFRVIDRGKTNHVEAVTIEFYSYGASKLEAATVDQELRGVMENILSLPEISSVRFGGGNDAKDEELKRYRYRSYFNITIMEV